jgi:hypothetical protein
MKVDFSIAVWFQVADDPVDDLMQLGVIELIVHNFLDYGAHLGL